MAWRMIKAVLILPGTAVVIVPGIIYLLTAGTGFAGWVSPPDQWPFWAGLAVLGTGLLFALWTATLFVAIGRGTPAPWDPPKKLVVRGPYRYVRNPMITSVLFLLAGEALVWQSWPIGWWAMVFFAANLIYFPLSEEKGLEHRFGDNYLAYKANVPRWFPRLTPWNPPLD